MNKKPHTESAADTPSLAEAERFKVEVIVPRGRLDSLESALLAAGALSVTCSEVTARWPSFSTGARKAQHHVRRAEQLRDRKRHSMWKIEIVTPRDQLSKIRKVVEDYVQSLHSTHCELRVVPVVDHTTFTIVSPADAPGLEKRSTIVFECIFDTDALP